MQRRTTWPFAVPWKRRRRVHRRERRRTRRSTSEADQTKNGDGLRWVMPVKRPQHAAVTGIVVQVSSYYCHYIRSYDQQVADMPQASKKRRRQAHGLAEESLTTASPALDQPSLRQTHHLTADSLTAGKSPPPGRTAQEKEFANFLIGTISASPSRRSISKEEILSVATRRFGLSERRAKALREDVIDYLDASAWSKAGAPPGRSHRRTRG
jgi:hypothetical protein